MTLKQDVDVVYYDREDQELPQGKGVVWVTKKPHCLKIMLLSDSDNDVESFNVSSFKDIPTESPDGTTELILAYKKPKTCNKIMLITDSTNKLRQLINMLNSKSPPSSDRRSVRRSVFCPPSDDYLSGIHESVTKLPELEEFKHPSLFLIYTYFTYRQLNKDCTDASVFDSAANQRDKYFADTGESRSLRDKKDKSLITAVKNWSSRCKTISMSEQADDAQQRRCSASNTQRPPVNPATISLQDAHGDDSMSDYEPTDPNIDTISDAFIDNVGSTEDFSEILRYSANEDAPNFERELNATERLMPINRNIGYKGRRIGKKYISMDDSCIQQSNLSDYEIEDEENEQDDNFSKPHGFAPRLADIQLSRSRLDTSVSGASAATQSMMAVSRANTVPSAVFNIYDVQNIMPGMEAYNNRSHAKVSFENGFNNNGESQRQMNVKENVIDSSVTPLISIAKAMSQPPNALKKTAKRNAPLPFEVPRSKRSCLDPYTDNNFSQQNWRISGDTFIGEQSTTDSVASQVPLSDPTSKAPPTGLSMISTEEVNTNIIATTTTTSGVSFPSMEPLEDVRETLSPDEEDQFNSAIMFNFLGGLSPFSSLPPQQDVTWDPVLNNTFSMETIGRTVPAEEISIPPQVRIEPEDETSQSSEYQLQPCVQNVFSPLNIDFENLSLDVDNTILEQCARSAGILPEHNETIESNGQIHSTNVALPADSGMTKQVTPVEQDHYVGETVQETLPVVEEHVHMEVVTAPVVDEVPVAAPSASPDVEQDENDAVVPASPVADVVIVPEVAAPHFAPDEEVAAVDQGNQENVQDGGEDIWAGRDMLVDLIDDGIYVSNLTEKHLLRQFKMNIDLALDNTFLIIVSSKEREMLANEIGSALEERFRDEIDALPFKYDNLPEGGLTRRLHRMSHLFMKYFGNAHPISQCPICVKSDGLKVPFPNDETRKKHLLTKDHMKVVRRLSRHYNGTDKIKQFTLDYSRLKVVKRVVEDISFPTDAHISAKISTMLDVNMEVLLELIDRVKQGVLHMKDSSQLFSAVEHCKVCKVSVVNKEEHVLSPEHINGLENEDYIECIGELQKVKTEVFEAVKKEEPVDNGYEEGSNAPTGLENNDSGITEPGVLLD